VHSIFNDSENFRDVKKTTLRQLFLASIKILATTKGMEGVKLAGRVMPVSGKPSYWAYSKVTKTQAASTILNAKAIIYVNLKDIDTKEKLLRAVAHESGHIISDLTGADYGTKRDELYNFLTAKLLRV